MHILRKFFHLSEWEWANHFNHIIFHYIKTCDPDILITFLVDFQYFWFTESLWMFVSIHLWESFHSCVDDEKWTHCSVDFLCSCLWSGTILSYCMYRRQYVWGQSIHRILASWVTYSVHLSSNNFFNEEHLWKINSINFPNNRSTSGRLLKSALYRRPIIKRRTHFFNRHTQQILCAIRIYDPLLRMKHNSYLLICQSFIVWQTHCVQLCTSLCHLNIE